VAPFDRSYTISYQSATVSIPDDQSCAIFEIFDIEEHHDLEITRTANSAWYVHRWNLETRGYLIAANSMGLSSFTSTQCAPKKSYIV